MIYVIASRRFHTHCILVAGEPQKKRFNTHLISPFTPAAAYMPPCTLYTSVNPRSTNTDAACADRTPAAHNTYVGLVGSNSLSATGAPARASR